MHIVYVHAIYLLIVVPRSVCVPWGFFEEAIATHTQQSTLAGRAHVLHILLETPECVMWTHTRADGGSDVKNCTERCVKTECVCAYCSKWVWVGARALYCVGVYHLYKHLTHQLTPIPVIL
jgi:hypothetical protein